MATSPKQLLEYYFQNLEEIPAHLVITEKDIETYIARHRVDTYVSPRAHRLAFKYFSRQVAFNNDRFAQFVLGEHHEFGLGVGVDHKKAYEWYEKSANQGYHRAQLKMGLFHREGKGGAIKNEATERRWLEAAVKQNNAEAQRALAESLCYSKSQPLDCSRGLELLKASLKARNTGDTLYHIGYIHFSGAGGIPVDYTKAKAWYTKADKKGDAMAAHGLGVIYNNGLGVPVDFEKAYEYVKRGAQRGLAESQRAVGEMYLYGEGVDKNLVEAYAWLMDSQKKQWHPIIDKKIVKIKHSLSKTEFEEARQLAETYINKY